VYWTWSVINFHREIEPANLLQYFKLFTVCEYQAHKTPQENNCWDTCPVVWTVFMEQRYTHKHQSRFQAHRCFKGLFGKVKKSMYICLLHYFQYWNQCGRFCLSVYPHAYFPRLLNNSDENRSALNVVTWFGCVPYRSVITSVKEARSIRTAFLSDCS